jgi:hypothetical protein
MKHIWEKIKMHAKFWHENRDERSHLGDPSLDLTITLKWILKK